MGRRALEHTPPTVSHTQQRSPGRHDTRDHHGTPSSSEFVGVSETQRLLCVSCHQSMKQTRGSCPSRRMATWSSCGPQMAQRTLAHPRPPHHCNLSDGNATDWVCHISSAGPIFPFKVVRLEDSDHRVCRLFIIGCVFK